MNIVVWITLGLVFARLAVELWLAFLNRRHVLAHAGEVPPAFRGIIDETTYKKSVAYTLAKGRLGNIEGTCNTVVLLIVLFSGVLPWAFQLFSHGPGQSAWAMAAFLFTAGFAMSLPGLPFDWHAQFRLEQKFGFNTTTPKIWWTDRLKGLLLALGLGYPLLVLVLKIVEWTGVWWWLWAWAALLAFQLLMAVLAPVLILPLFNKFTPLPDGDLRQRLFELAQRTRFRAQSIQLMDGSKRSRHSNAFFTGFGRFRKIVLFDTLVQQLTGPELVAVLAHEIGHFKKRHIPKMLIFSSAGSLAGFYLLSVLARQEWFYRAFGFGPGTIAPALLLFGLLAGTVTFWFSPLIHWWSRRYEYQADAFAARVMSETQSLVGALRKLNDKNLSNLTPHPCYSAFYYSHPTLLEREQALKG
ncbi:MAG: M48 family metallopeptidase [Limisphaerales bacterium]